MFLSSRLVFSDVRVSVHWMFYHIFLENCMCRVCSHPSRNRMLLYLVVSKFREVVFFLSHYRCPLLLSFYYDALVVPCSCYAL